MLFFLLACTHPSPVDSNPSDTATDTNALDTADSGDPADSGDSADSGDTGTPADDIVTLAAEGFDLPVDAAPTADGSQFYVATADAGLFVVPADMSGAPELVDGSLREAKGLLVSLDGSEVFVSARIGDGERVIQAVHLDGSGTIPHPETEGLDPGGMSGMDSLMSASHNEDIVFTGKRRSSAVGEEGAVYLFEPHGEPMLLATGFDGGLPEAVEIAPDRSVYVSVVSGDEGSIWHIPADIVAERGAADPATAATRVLDGYRPGQVPGIALTRDSSTLLISSVSDAGTSQVVLLDLASGSASIFDDVIRENPSSGGIHRARDRDIFAWSDYQRPGGVYKVDLE